MIVTNSLTGGGAERSMNLLADELSSRGWPIALVPINFSGPDLMNPMCDIYPLFRQWRGSTLATFSSYLRFNQIVKSFNPEILILNCDLPELFGSLLLSKRTLIVVQHSSLPWGSRKQIGKFIRGVLRFRNAIWVAVSPHLKVWPNETSTTAILENPVMPIPIETYSQSVKTLKRLVYIGRLSVEKQPEIVIKAAKLLGVDAILIGDGPLRNALTESCVGSVVKIEFAGWIVNPWSIVKNGDLVLVPSTFEGDGLIVLEAIQRRVPILISRISDFAKFDLPEKNYCEGLIEYVNAAQKYSNNLDGLVIPIATANKILEPRSIDLIGKKWEILLDSL